MELTTEILKSRENNLNTISVFLDLSKAFDTLDPKILLSKLEIDGMRGTVLNWFESYLTNRQLRVKCEVSSENKTQYSKLYDVEFGTPQGSCLGPLLFLLFTNDLYLNIDYCSAILFADDTSLQESQKHKISEIVHQTRFNGNIRLVQSKQTHIKSWENSFHVLWKQ